jgi:hypothetical protein
MAGSVDALARSQFGPAIDKDVRLLADTLGPSDQRPALMDLAGDLIRQIAAPVPVRNRPPAQITRNEALRRPQDQTRRV